MPARLPSVSIVIPVYNSAWVLDDCLRRIKNQNYPKRLIEIIYTSGGYTMTALAINSLGIQLEPGFPRFP